MKIQRMMSILHGIFTSAFSLVYCDKFSYEKLSLRLNPNAKSPEPQLWSFLVLGNLHAHGLGSMSDFFTLACLVGWQVWNNFVSNLWQ